MTKIMRPEHPFPVTKKENGWALIPFFVFLFFYLGLSIFAKDFYFIPMPIAFLVASASAFVLNKKATISQKMEVFAKGMGETNIMIMCMIFILAGAFASVAKAAGSVDAAVRISRSLVPESLILPEFFIISCLISLGIGTSCGTIAALVPIAIGIADSGNISPALMIGAVIGGAMFGDNMSMISDTTIAATRTQNVEMRDKFIKNFKIALPAAIVTLIIYLFLPVEQKGNAQEITSSLTDYLLVFPYILILIGALLNLNVMALLFKGTFFALIIGVALKTISFKSGLQVIGNGTLGMAETLIVAILAGGLLALIRHNGGIAYILKKIEKVIRGKNSCEFGIMLLVSAVNLFTANNTVAIVVAGPLAKDLSSKYKCDSRRIASILDSASCVVQGLIPYGAQILIAIGIAKGANLQISTLELIGVIYYPMLLAISLIASIIINSLMRKQ